MAEINFPDPAVTNPWQDPVSLQWWQHDGAGWLRVGATEEPVLTGYKNVLINGRLGPVGSPWIINQREFDGDWAALPNEYGYDRWAKNSLTEIIQHIEPGNVILGQTYTLSWEGGGGGSFSTDPQDSATASPFTGIASDNALGLHTDVVVPIGAFNIQLELGSVPTPFEVRPVGLELQLCQRYYFRIGITVNMPNPVSSGSYRYGISFPTAMRIDPIIDNSGINLTNASDGGAKFANEISFEEFVVAVASNSTSTASGIVKFTAEL